MIQELDYPEFHVASREGLQLLFTACHRGLMEIFPVDALYRTWTNTEGQVSWCYLTNRFHVAACLFSNRAQMTSKCDKNKKVTHEVIVTVLTTFWCLLWSITEQTQHGIYLFYIIKKQTTTAKAFSFQNLSTWLESWPLPRTLPTLTNMKKSHVA